MHHFVSYVSFFSNGSLIVLAILSISRIKLLTCCQLFGLSFQEYLMCNLQSHHSRALFYLLWKQFCLTHLFAVPNEAVQHNRHMSQWSNLEWIDILFYCYLDTAEGEIQSQIGHCNFLSCTASSLGIFFFLQLFAMI